MLRKGYIKQIYFNESSQTIGIKNEFSFDIRLKLNISYELFAKQLMATKCLKMSRMRAKTGI